MNGPEFIAVYDRNPPPNIRLNAKLNDMMVSPRAWSSRFGEILYDHLDGKNLPESEVDKTLDEYTQWYQTKFQVINETM